NQMVTKTYNEYMVIIRQIAAANRKGLNKNQKEKLALLDNAIEDRHENKPQLFTRKVHEAIGKLQPSDEMLNQLLQDYKKMRNEEAFELVNSDSDLLQLAAHETCLMAALASDARVIYQDSKKARRAVDFNDLMELAEQLTQLTQNKQDSVQNRFELILVDEFQDTDSRQARILRNIAGDNLGKGMLFVVGDSRQAIYRFRGARPEELDDLRNEMDETGKQSLVRNYRSRRQIIRFVNHIANILYENLPQLETGLNNKYSDEEGAQFVKFHWSLFLNEATNQNQLLANPDIHAEARSLATLIREMIDSKTLVGSRSGQMRPMQPGDIVFLSRSRTHWSIYERALWESGLEAYLDSSSGLFSRQEIRDLVNLLALVENPSDDLLLAAVLRGPFGAISDESLLYLSQKDSGCSLAEIFWRADFNDFFQAASTDVDAMDGFRALLKKLSRVRTELPPSQVVELAMELTAYHEMIGATSLRGSQPVQNLDVLVNDARSFDHDPDFGWPAMIRQWISDLEGGKVNEAVAEPPGNMIRFLTIHAAKGLQFPVVIMIGVNGKEQVDQTSWKIHPEFGLVTKSRSGDSDDSDSDQNHLAWLLAMLESKKAEAKEVDNLLYVAATRAEDYLIVSASFKLKEPNQELKATGEMLKRIERVFKLETGEFIGPAHGESIVTVIKNQNTT
ncbi:MAG: UvrD-helicase domain-containing protein, partial [bacterium]